MSTSHSTHSRHRRHWRSHWTWRQINYSLTIWSWACNSLRWTFADQQTITWTSHVLFTRRCIPDRLQTEINTKNIFITDFRFEIEIKKKVAYSRFIALIAFDYMLFPFQCYVNHCLTYTTRNHRHTTGTGNLIGRWKIIGTYCWRRMLQGSWKQKLGFYKLSPVKLYEINSLTQRSSFFV